MHSILPKTTTREHAEVVSSEGLITLNNDIKSLLISRLVDSFGRQGKSFELAIENDGINSCFNLIKELSSQNEAHFIEQSKKIAQLLAEAQDTRNSIPGGYFMLIEAITRPTNNNVYIIMKAEIHNALGVVERNVQAMNHIFLSPAQKMYKVGIFEQVSTGRVLSINHFKGYLFDSQFNDGTRLAEYFYKDFLGLTIEGNAQVQTKMFYDMFTDTINNVYKTDLDNRNSTKDLLMAELNNQELNMNAHDIITRIIPLNDRDKFISKIGSKFQNSFTKDSSLISRKLDKKCVLLTDSIRISAPTNSFDNDDIIISVDPNDPAIKIVKIRIHGNE